MKQTIFAWLMLLGLIGVPAALAQSPQATPALPPVVDASPVLTPRGLAEQAQNAATATPAPSAAAPAASPAAAPDLIATPVQSAALVPNPPSKAAKDDLWERIRRGFAMPNLDGDLVTNREQWYATRPDYIARMTERSKKYLFHIVEELEVRKMPMELALLPFIESAFNPQAVSTAKAAGMWQFIPSTGKYYSLKQNTFRDDRRDVQASTRAALDYLQKLHGMFGDWHLALAAYNWGEGSVGRAIAKNQKLGLPTSYVDLKMPNETRYYVPKLQAVKNIVANPEQFNTVLGDIENHPYFQSVSITRDMDVDLAAKLANVPLADFKALNPSLSRPVILAAGTPQVLMPWDNADTFVANLNQYSGQLASWTAWVAPTALKPQDAAKRVGMSEAQLREVNGIALKSGLIQAGSTLLIPRSVKKQEDVAAHVADNGQLTIFTPKAKQKAKVKGKAKGNAKGNGQSKKALAPQKRKVNAKGK
jgi:membrane-bound lytic murein transglycosylase D